MTAAISGKGVGMPLLEMEQVTAVELETTGDLSVLTGGQAVDPVLLAGVRGAERLR